MSSDIEFLKQLRAAFQVEAKELLIAIGNGLVEMERASAPEAAVVVETIFRHAHSLKGAARAVNEYDIESLCQAVEDAFARWKSQKLSPSPEMFDVLHRAIGAMDCLLDGCPNLSASPAMLIGQLNQLSHRTAPVAVRDSSSIHNVEGMTQVAPGAEEAIQLATVDHHCGEKVVEPVAQTSPALPTPAGTPQPRLPDTVRVSTGRLDTLLRETEELLSIKLTDRQRANELESLLVEVSRWRQKAGQVAGSSSVTSLSQTEAGGIGGQSLEEYINQTQLLLASMQASLGSLHRGVLTDSRRRAAQIDELLEDVKKVLLMPFSTLLERFPRLVRDLARDLGKEVELNVQGGEIEVDRRILEELSDPLIHLVRNCIDHGIEPSHARVLAGKPACGSLAISISQLDGGRVQLSISDDGAGIDPARLAQKALQMGIIDPAQLDQMDASEVRSLLFRSGFSTSPIVTDISGRGLGLTIVAEKLEKLGGKVSVESKIGEGTVFLLTLPITLTTFRALRVQVSGQEFFIPTTYVDSAIRLPSSNIPTIQGRPVIHWRDLSLPMVDLGDILGLSPATQPVSEGNFKSALVLRSGETRIAFSVDCTLTDHEVLAKNLGPQLRRIRYITGAAILPSGQILPILDVPDLVKSAGGWQATTANPPTLPTDSRKSQQTILVAEDSITSRTLLKGILESAGYRVLTAVDGIDAFTILRTETPDLVVSDIEMPRLNGLDLTARIRDESRLTDLPVVLVSALESREDRERGIEVGANAYIVKSSFDQSNLLDVIHRLI